MAKETQVDIKIALMTVIALTALLGGQGFVMSLLLDPVKQSTARIEKRMDKMEVKMEDRMGKLEGRVGKLEDRMGKLEDRVGRIEVKIDKLLVRNNI